MFDPSPIVERDEDIASSSSGTKQTVPVIIVRYRDEKVVMQRTSEYKYTIERAADAFSSLVRKNLEKLYLEGLVEGSVESARIDEQLWPLVAHTLSEVTLRVRPSNSALDLARRRQRAIAEARLQLITEVATSPIIVVAAGDEYQLDINLVSATVLELKRVIQRKFGLPVSRQQLYMQLPVKDIWPAEDEDILASVGVIRGSRLSLGIKRASW